MSAERFFVLTTGSHSILVDAASVQQVRRVHDAGPGLTTTAFGQLTLYDLADWFQVAATETRMVVVLTLQEAWVGVSADTLDDTVSLDGPLQPLPPLIQELGFDPAIAGVASIDGTPILLVDLERFARLRLSAHQTNSALDKELL